MDGRTSQFVIPTRHRMSGLIAVATIVLSGCSALNQARLDQFDAALSANASATTALERWCHDNALANPAVITVERIKGNDRDPSAEVRALLRATVDQPIRYRHVQLRCGQNRMSVAHNWYVPDRLPDQMNQMLENSEVPFGRIVQSLGFSRERLSSSRIADPACGQGTVLVQRAILRIPNGYPIAMVIECYPRSVLKGRSGN